MNLNGKRIGGVENFEEEGESSGRVARVFFAEDFGSMVFPEVVQRSPDMWPMINDRLIVGAVGDFPGFADSWLVWG